MFKYVWTVAVSNIREQWSKVKTESDHQGICQGRVFHEEDLKIKIKTKLINSLLIKL